jgi:hypothetical protein
MHATIISYRFYIVYNQMQTQEFLGNYQHFQTICSIL